MWYEKLQHCAAMNIAFKCDNNESSTCTVTFTKCANCDGDEAAQGMPTEETVHWNASENIRKWKPSHFLKNQKTHLRIENAITI